MLWARCPTSTGLSVLSTVVTTLLLLLLPHLVVDWPACFCWKSILVRLGLLSIRTFGDYWCEIFPTDWMPFLSPTNRVNDSEIQSVFCTHSCVVICIFQSTLLLHPTMKWCPTVKLSVDLLSTSEQRLFNVYSS